MRGKSIAGDRHHLGTVMVYGYTLGLGRYYSAIPRKASSTLLAR
jgi:hypothetical protein